MTSEATSHMFLCKSKVLAVYIWIYSESDTCNWFRIYKMLWTHFCCNNQ